MNRKIVITFLLACRSFCPAAMAQDSSTCFKTYKIGIFAPLYLDSIFNGNNYRLGKNFPRYVSPGLDFIQGAEIALDSMPLPNGNINASIFDSKSTASPIDSLVFNHKLDSLDLIIGSVKDAEYSKLAGFAKAKNIPFISATYPNDGGITDNPFLAIVNSTLKAHCEAIYSYLLQSHGTDKIFLCRKSGTQEDKVAGYFKAINEQDGKPLLNIQTLMLDSNFYSIRSKLDSNRQNIIIGASLDEGFADKLVAAAYPCHKTYPITLIGMPNWDGFSFYSPKKKNNYSGFPIYFTSPYFNFKSDNYSKMIQNIYLKKYKGKPSDMTYKGFETVFIFSRLLTKYPNDLMSHLNDYAYKVFSDYNFKPATHGKNSSNPAYFENKHVYFLKTEGGIVSKAW